MRKRKHKSLAWTAPIASPKEVSKFFGKSLRNLNHLIQTTIGDPVMPARGRGFGARFSLQDIVLMAIGSKLLAHHFPPPIARRGVETLRAHWLEFTTYLDLYRNYSEQEKYLREQQREIHEKAISEGYVELYDSQEGWPGRFWVKPGTGETLPDDWGEDMEGMGLFVCETEYSLSITFRWISEVLNDLSIENSDFGPMTIFNTTAFSTKVLKKWVTTYGIKEE